MTMCRKPAFNIAYITTVPVIGGVELNLLRVLSSLQKNGINPAVVLMPSGPLLARFREMGFSPCTFHLHQKRWRSFWRYAQCLCELVVPLFTHSVDLVHINHHYGLHYTTLAAQIALRPYIVHVRGIESVAWTKNNLSYLTKAQRVIAVSHAVKQRLLEGGLTSEKVTVIYNGIDLESLKKAPPYVDFRTELGFQEDTLLVGLIGRMEPLKGVADFLYAARLVLEDFPSARFLIVGSGEKQFETEMQLLAQDLGLQKMVRFLGFRDDVANILPVLDALAIATYDSVTGQGESLSNIALEAMASRTLVVARRAGGVVELLDDGRGLLVDPNGIEPLAVGLCCALGMSDEKRQQITNQAYESVCRDFKIERQVRQIVEVYDQALREIRC
jgi:glycosyltransferase involved in cell wall biosynthesis